MVDYRVGVSVTLIDWVVFGDGSRLNIVVVIFILLCGYWDIEFYKFGDYVLVYFWMSEVCARYFVAYFGIDFDD